VIFQLIRSFRHPGHRAGCIQHTTGGDARITRPTVRPLYVMVYMFSPSVIISPIEFELQVKTWLDKLHYSITDYSSTHREMIHGDSGEYEIDILVKFGVFGGAEIQVLVECKRYKNPIKRDIVMILEAKLRDTNAHKGIIFSTSGFQKGAIEYANSRGIATVTVQDGKSTYQTRVFGQQTDPPPWIRFSKFVGWFRTFERDSSISGCLISDESVDSLDEWLKITK
jgi:restriction system protein